MTSKLKCPFCGEELDKDISGELGCPNDKCKESMFLIGTEELWQALIQAKQDLKIATNALREIYNDYQEDSTERAEKALKQIEHKE